MKILWLLSLLVLCTGITKAQRVFEGQVLDKTTQEEIFGVTVTLLKEKITTQTNERGYFRISAENVISMDTLVFSSVGYITFRLPVSDYQGNSIFTLQPSNTTLEQVVVTNRKLKTERLNGFDLGNVKKDRDYTPQPFTTQFTYAKLFNAPEEDVLVTKIELGRTVFDSPEYPILPLVKSNPRTRFLIHILSVNPGSRLPDKVLFTKQISLSDNANWVAIDLTEDGIVLASKEFFVAVEWLRIPYNEVFKLDKAPRVRAVKKNGKQLYEDVSMYRTLYQPALVRYGSQKNASPAFIKNSQGKWLPYPGSNVALSAIVKY